MTPKKLFITIFATFGLLATLYYLGYFLVSKDFVSDIAKSAGTLIKFDNNVEITDGKSLTLGGVSQSSWPSIPTGAVMFFNSYTCPSGWSELVDARGRYLVGLPVGGVLSSMTGAALSAQENRPVGKHDHGGSVGASGVHTGHSYGDMPGWGGSFYSTFGGANQGAHSHSISNSGDVAGTNAPYLQLLVCQKN